ncbi:MAG: DNA polymerase III subunit gamma/tau [Blastochloris sp.]|nr:DNA polymerase III subunit gamma/tau [Blastochloris sp.]
MSYQVLARKYRPLTFKDVVGQDHVVQTLTNAINTGRIAHAFLFVGPRGIGKTSTARILAKALNCPGGPKADFDPNDPVCQEITDGRCMDVLEIDGASNNSVEQIRELRENVQYAPTSGKFKIYIIDEVHMLTSAAFNALLKTLEEPPAHVKFIFATTEVHKVLPTILSRCQRFDLKRISEIDLVKQLKLIAQSEGITVSNDALKLLARNAEGGMRDAESAFDQLISFCGHTIEEKDVLEIFGLTGSQDILDLAQSIQMGHAESALKQVRLLVSRGKDLTRLTQELLRHFRNLLVFIISPQMSAEELDADDLHHFENLRPLPSETLILAFIEELVRIEEKIRFALVKDVLFEISIIRLCQQHQKVSIEDVIKQLTGNAPTPRPTTSPERARTPEPKPASILSSPEKITALPTSLNTETARVENPKPLNDEELWKLAVAAIKKIDVQLSRPLDCCDFLERKDNTISLRMTAQHGIYEKLTQPESFRILEQSVQKTFGSPFKVEIIFNERPPEHQNEQHPSSTPTPPTKTVAKASATKDKTRPSTNTSSPGTISKADFENDPLIKDAVTRFKGRIVSIKES